MCVLGCACFQRTWKTKQLRVSSTKCNFGSIFSPKKFFWSSDNDFWCLQVCMSWMSQNAMFCTNSSSLLNALVMNRIQNLKFKFKSEWVRQFKIVFWWILMNFSTFLDDLKHLWAMAQIKLKEVWSISNVTLPLHDILMAAFFNVTMLSDDTSSCCFCQIVWKKIIWFWEFWCPKCQARQSSSIFVVDLSSHDTSCRCFFNIVWKKIIWFWEFEWPKSQACQSLPLELTITMGVTWATVKITPSILSSENSDQNSKSLMTLCRPQ